MHKKTRLAIIFVLTLLGVVVLTAVIQAAPGAVPLIPNGSPTVVSYQGEVRISNAPYSGMGYFKFAVTNAAGTATYWSNDGSSVGANEPTTSVGLTVSEGLFSILLGDTTLTGMDQALTAIVFSQPDRYLRVWFSPTSGGSFDQLMPDTRIAAVPYALQAEKAVDADTVDGLHANQLRTHYQNVVVVAKSGGDYTSVQTAINSITGAAADNPYLVWIAPGVYSETVVMKPYVHLQGAGQDATIITSTASSIDWAPTQVTLVLTREVNLRDITVGNSGSGDVNTALLVKAGVTHTLVADVTARALGDGVTNCAIFVSGSGTDVTLDQVTALAQGGSNHNISLVNTNSAAAMLRGGTFTARGGERAWAIFTSGSGTKLEAENITTLAEYSNQHNSGMSNYNGAEALLRGGSFTGRGGNQADGVGNSLNSTMTAVGITALAENGIENYGFGTYNVSTSTLHTGNIIARGGGNNYAFSNELTVTVKAENVTALAENGTGNNNGLWNVNNATLVLHGASLTGRGGENAYGINNRGSDTMLAAVGVTALGVGGNNNYGLYNADTATVDIIQSVVEGTGNSIFRDGGSVTVSNSRLAGNGVNGAVTCVLVTRDTGAGSVSIDGSTCP